MKKVILGPAQSTVCIATEDIKIVRNLCKISIHYFYPVLGGRIETNLKALPVYMYMKKLIVQLSLKQSKAHVGRPTFHENMFTIL